MASDWAGLLDKDETILWQGRPDGGFAFKPSMIFTTVFGLFFSGFALFWMIMASTGGGYFWTFGLIHFFAGFAVILGPLFGGMWMRRHTWYTLTDRRAFIATDLPIKGRSLKSYPIIADTVIDYQDNALPSVFFASKTVPTKNGSKEVPIGFERIVDGPSVLKHIRKIQQDTA